MRSFLYGLTVLCLVFAASCTKDDSLIDDNSSESTEARGFADSGIWYVNLFSEDGNIQTQHFNQYQIKFQASGVITATSGNTEISGTWSKITDSGKKKLVLSFPATSNFDELSEDWEIVLSDNNNIKLKHISGGNGGTDILELGRNQVTIVGGTGTTNTNSGTIIGQWKVTRYLDKDKDRTSYYTGVSFDFKTGGVITATKGTSITNGTWKIYTDSGKQKLDITFPAVNKLNEINEDWEIISQNATSILLKNVSGGNGGVSYLDFKK